jgi:hypothetical protein
MSDEEAGRIKLDEGGSLTSIFGRFEHFHMYALRGTLFSAASDSDAASFGQAQASWTSSSMFGLRTIASVPLTSVVECFRFASMRHVQTLRSVSSTASTECSSREKRDAEDLLAPLCPVMVLYKSLNLSLPDPSEPSYVEF